MKRQQVQELHTKALDELTRDLLGVQEEILKQDREWINGKLTNTNAIKNLRKDKARILTVLHSKSMQPVAVEPSLDKAKQVEEPKKEKGRSKKTKQKEEAK